MRPVEHAVLHKIERGGCLCVNDFPSGSRRQRENSSKTAPSKNGWLSGLWHWGQFSGKSVVIPTLPSKWGTSELEVGEQTFGVRRYVELEQSDGSFTRGERRALWWQHSVTALPGFTTWKQSTEDSESDETLRKCLDMANDSRRDKGQWPLCTSRRVDKYTNILASIHINQSALPSRGPQQR